MSNDSSQDTKENGDLSDNAPPPPAGDVTRMDDAKFAQSVETLLEYGEKMRLDAMRAQRNRGFIATSLGLVSIMCGAAGFGWYLLVEIEITRALGSIMIGLVVAVALYLWSLQSLNTYQKSYKAKFLPRMAKLLGGFKYYPARGISRNVLAKTGVVPGHDVYKAEDCFMGQYKGVKVMFSEARLLFKKKYLEPIFDGIFVLIEAPDAEIEGHTIITADRDMVKRNRKNRWKALKDFSPDSDGQGDGRFTIVSSAPTKKAQKLVTPSLLKELAEAADTFDTSPLTCVFFRQKYVFLMIPYNEDMFEASDIHVPITTKRHAMRCKKEIEKILEVIDVFDLYAKG